MDVIVGMYVDVGVYMHVYVDADATVGVYM